jgi:hypothetical protein
MRRTAFVNTSQSINCHHQSADDGAHAAHSPKTLNATFRETHMECGSGASVGPLNPKRKMVAVSSKRSSLSARRLGRHGFLPLVRTLRALL